MLHALNIILIHPFLFLLTDLSSQMRSIPKPNNPDPSIINEHLPGGPDHQEAAESNTIPPGYLFKENRRFVAIKEPFSAAVTKEDWIVGRMYHNSIQPIYNTRLQIVGIHLHTHVSRLLSLEERQLLHFYDPYSPFNNNNYVNRVDVINIDQTNYNPQEFHPSYSSLRNRHRHNNLS